MSRAAKRLAGVFRHAAAAAFVVALVLGGNRATIARAAQLAGGAVTAHANTQSNVATDPSATATSSGDAGNVTAGADAGSAAPPSGGDPLVRNGFASVLCREPRLQPSLSLAAQRNCRTSSFVAAAAPTGNYAFDVHIDTGLLPDGNTVAMFIQDLFLTPVWTALVWLVHALLIALEWCYSIDLLDDSTMGTVAGALRSAQATVTQPWMVVVLAIAACLALYQGLIRRRVAQTLGEFLLMMAMMAGGLWVILNPSGTIGYLGRWANQSSLEALGAVTQGDPGHADQALAQGTQDIFGAAIGAPWCYLEFGDVSWCREAARLDPRLHAAALRIASREGSMSGSATLLHEALTNGDLFLALPANQAERNSINDSNSLLRVLCASSDAGHCRGPTAAQATFRTSAGTWPRAGGLLLIVLGSLGMIALLAFIALRLLGAAVGALFYLLLAPVAVLAPALGDGGRGVFRGWATRLLGAAMAKLIYSVLLGVVLLALRVLLSLGTLGWWTQWLLIGAFWWMVFQQRDQVLRYAALGHRETGVRGVRAASALLYTRELRRLAHLPGAARVAGRPPPGAPGPRSPTAARLSRTRPPRAEPPADAGPALLGEQVQRALDGEHEDALAGVREAPHIQQRVADQRRRLARLRSEIEPAAGAGDIRRRTSLMLRADDLESEIAAGQAALDRVGARGVSASAARGDGPGNAEVRRAEWIRLLDRQAILPAARERRETGERVRDYRALAGLAGLTPAAYARLAPGPQRAARLVVDRELDQRRRVLGLAGDRHAAQVPRPRQPAGVALSPSRTGAAQAPTPSGTRWTRESAVLRRERQFERSRRGGGSDAPPEHPRPPSRRG